jgi:hypothetical protein
VDLASSRWEIPASLFWSTVCVNSCSRPTVVKDVSMLPSVFLLPLLLLDETAEVRALDVEEDPLQDVRARQPGGVRPPGSMRLDGLLSVLPDIDA